MESWKLELSAVNSKNKKDQFDGLNYRVIATNGIPKHNISEGTKGGYIASCMNLLMSQDKCTTDVWLDEECGVFDQACLTRGACLKGRVVLKDNARVTEGALIIGESQENIIQDYAIVENAVVQDSNISDCTHVLGQGTSVSRCTIEDYVLIDGGATIENSALSDSVFVHGTGTKVLNAKLTGDVTVTDGAIIDMKDSLCAIRRGNFGRHAVICSPLDYMVMELETLKITVYNSSHPDGPCISVYSRTDNDAAFIHGNGTIEQFLGDLTDLLESGHLSSNTFDVHFSQGNKYPSTTERMLLTNLSAMAFHAYEVLRLAQKRNIEKETLIQER